MGIGDFVKGQFIDVIEHVDDGGKLLVYKHDRYKNEIKQGAQLIVREGQSAVFIYKGQITDIFAPGAYRLDTGNLPVLSSLKAVPFLFNSPIKSDLYFINTTQFIGNRWGTKSPILIRDKDFGIVRVTAFGTYSFRITEPITFIREVFGARKMNMTYEILQYLNSFVGESIAMVLANSNIPVLDLAADYRNLAGLLGEKVNEKAAALGILIQEAVIENIGLPENVERVVDEQSGMGLASKDMATYVQYQTVQAMRDASKQQGGLAGIGASAAFGAQITHTMAETSSVNSPMDKLREYKSLLDDEIITQEEFDRLKSKLLNL
ncbi:MAG: SPFH domain-containing protein [Firmicutes bacterium]|nr:SPFH domain-containing protein [Bacillota bacterium]